MIPPWLGAQWILEHVMVTKAQDCLSAKMIFVTLCSKQMFSRSSGEYANLSDPVTHFLFCTPTIVGLWPCIDMPLNLHKTSSHFCQSYGGSLIA